MRIENVGFYETRGGRLAYVLAKMPDGTNSEYQWVACEEDGFVDVYTNEGVMNIGGQNAHDLIRHLPTVKSWDDPIPPQEPPAVTVYTEWLSVGKECGRAWTGWTKGDVKPCYAVAKLRTVEVPANG
jgi:hypothetical protein